MLNCQRDAAWLRAAVKSSSVKFCRSPPDACTRTTTLEPQISLGQLTVSRAHRTSLEGPVVGRECRRRCCRACSPLRDPLHQRSPEGVWQCLRHKAPQHTPTATSDCEHNLPIVLAPRPLGPDCAANAQSTNRLPSTAARHFAMSLHNASRASCSRALFELAHAPRHEHMSGTASSRKRE